MIYDLTFGLDPITKTRIFIFKKTRDSFYIAKRNMDSKIHSNWFYYKGDFNWSYYTGEAKKYNTLIEMKNDYKKYITFLKECGYDLSFRH